MTLGVIGGVWQLFFMRYVKFDKTQSNIIGLTLFKVLVWSYSFFGRRGRKTADKIEHPGKI